MFQLSEIQSQKYFKPNNEFFMGIKLFLLVHVYM